MKTLEDVAQFMEEHEWTQGQAYDLHHDAYCLSAAMEAICGLDWPALRRGKAELLYHYDKENYLKLWDEFYIKTGLNPITFNDRIATKKEEVIAKLRSL